MAVDLSVFGRQQSLLDAQREFEARKQAQALQQLQVQSAIQNQFENTALRKQSLEQQQQFHQDQLAQRVMAASSKQAAPAPVIPVNNIDPSITGPEYLSKLDPNRAAVIKLIGDGNEKSTTILSRMKPEEKLSILADVARYNPNYSVNGVGAQKDFNTGKLGSTVRSLNVANSHLDTLGQLADALNNNDTQMFNKIGNAYASQTGNAAPTNFDTAKQIVADEVVKAVVGAGGTGADREEASRVINAANSPEQLKGAISTYKTLMQGQLKGLNTQYQAATGKNDFNKYLENPAPAVKFLGFEDSKK